MVNLITNMYVFLMVWSLMNMYFYIYVAVSSVLRLLIYMATVEKSYVLFARLCVELFQELPPLPSDESHGEITSLERQFLRKCQIELENFSIETDLPLVYVDESNYWRFIKTVRVLAEVFKNMKITGTTRKSIIQVCLSFFTLGPASN